MLKETREQQPVRSMLGDRYKYLRREIRAENMHDKHIKP